MYFNQWLIALIIGIALEGCLIVASLTAQPGYRSDDVVTWSDCRGVYAFDYDQQTVYAATSGGVCRLDRLTLAALDPWMFGCGLDQAVPLTGGRLILTHNFSNTIWLYGKELKYYRVDLDHWYEFDQPTGNIVALGETSDRVVAVVKGNPVEYLIIDPFPAMLLERTAEAPADVRWPGTTKKHAYKDYWEDRTLWNFDPADGTLTDKDFNRYRAAFDCYDDVNRRHFIAYPGLGIGVGDDRHLTLDVIQLGPLGASVSPMAFSADGGVWCAGRIAGQEGGISCFNRETGRWTSYRADRIYGLEEGNVRDILIQKQQVFFATGAGLTVCSSDGHTWKTYDRFDGLRSLELSALAVSGGQLFIGGRDGLDRWELPKGPAIRNSGKATWDKTVYDLAAEGDTVWSAGAGGLWRWQPDTLTPVDLSGAPSVTNPLLCLLLAGERLWVGSRGGVGEYNRRTGEWRNYPAVLLRGGLPLALAANDSILWIGADNGLFGYNFNSGGWIKYESDIGFPSQRMQSLAVEEDTLWIGSPGGLTRFLWNRPGRIGF